MSERKKKQPPMRMQNVFIFLLLAIFAVSAIFLTALSAQVYRDTVNISATNNEARTASAIIRGAAQSEDAGIASVREEAGLRVLAFANDYDGEIYFHRLYCADGYLRECLTSEDREFTAETGEPLIPMTSFEPVLKENGMLEAKVTLPEGQEETVYVYLRAGGAAE